MTRRWRVDTEMHERGYRTHEFGDSYFFRTANRRAKMKNHIRRCPHHLGYGIKKLGNENQGIASLSNSADCKEPARTFSSYMLIDAWV